MQYMTEELFWCGMVAALLGKDHYDSHNVASEADYLLKEYQNRFGDEE